MAVIRKNRHPVQAKNHNKNGTIPPSKPRTLFSRMDIIILVKTIPYDVLGNLPLKMAMIIAVKQNMPKGMATTGFPNIKKTRPVIATKRSRTTSGITSKIKAYNHPTA